ncbi:MAG TPA: hypothetical protein VH107_10335 [Lacipirellulaceae bacterium]|nr:hypothetical protein [Lacipirellulaceae bacterium]
MNRRSGSLLLAAFAAFLLVNVSPALATLKWYYDPLTGNVSFDSSETRSGGLYVYSFEVYANPAAFQFRTENLLHLTNSTFFFDQPNSVGEGSLSGSLNGLYTIGNILPTGLTEQFWTTSFKNYFTSGNQPYTDIYTDVIGGGPSADAEFIYGAPQGEFKNKTDLLDPNTLKWATTATLVYQPWDGKILIDTTGDSSGYITGYLLQSNGQLLASGFTPDTTGPYNSADANSIGAFADLIEPGIHTVGKILAPGLSLSEFVAKFTGAKFMPRAGYKGQSFDFATSGVSFSFEMAAVPEPACFVLVLGGVIAGLCGRFGRSLK